MWLRESVDHQEDMGSALLSYTGLRMCETSGTGRTVIRGTPIHPRQNEGLLGRTLQRTQPDGSGTAAASGRF